MRDEDKSKVQLIKELIEQRKQNVKAMQNLQFLKEQIQELKIKQSKNALISFREKYNFIFENTIVGIYQSSPKGHFTIVNSAFVGIFGYESPEELISLVQAHQLYVNSDDHTLCIQQVLKNDVASFEIQVYRKDGSKIWIYNYVRVVRDNNRNILCFEGIAIDITGRKLAEEELNNYRQYLEEKVGERTFKLELENKKIRQEIAELKKVEEALQKSEEKYRNLFYCANDAIYLYELKDGDKPSKFIEVNNVLCQKLGYSRDELLSMTSLDINPKEHSNKVYEVIQKNLIQGNVTCEMTHITKDGLKIPVEISSHAFNLGNKKVSLTIARDITDRKQSEEKLRKQQELIHEQFSYASALNLIAETIINNDNTQIILETMVGIIGSTLDVDRSLIYDMDFVKHQVIGLCEWLNPKTPGITATKNTYSLDFFIDASTFMKNYHQWMESHIDCYSTYASRDGSGDILHKHMQVKSGLWYPFSFREQGYFCLVFNQINYRRVWREEELEFITAVTKHVEIAIQKINFLSEQKQAQEALRLSEERFFKIFKSNPAPMVIALLSDGRLIDVNDAMVNYFGYERNEVIGKTIKRLNVFANADNLKYILMCGVNNNIICNMEIFFRTKSGELQIGLLSTEIIDVAGERCLLGVIQDITERRHMEEELIKANQKITNILESITDAFFTLDNDWKYIYLNSAGENIFSRICEIKKGSLYGENIWERFPLFVGTNLYHEYHRAMVEQMPVSFEFMSPYTKYYYEMNAYPSPEGLSVYFRDITERKNVEREMTRLAKLNLIGEMAAGIAHEIRNPMTTVRGLLQILGSKEEYVKYKEHNDLMIDELDRANNIIKEFLSLARDKADDLQPQNLNLIIKKIYPLIKADAMNYEKNTKIQTTDIPSILVNEKEIRQLLLNMARNGLEAMTKGGCLTISTSFINEEVVLVVQDEGRGIEPEVLNKLGTPFFTTKHDGTGLGLAISYSIAKRHNAKIDVKTSSNGTAFCVRFKPSLEITLS